MDLAGKTAFVTGGASGVGFGIARALTRAGARVMLCDIEAPALDKAVEALRLTNADVDGVVADVSLKGELQKAAEATIARYGSVNVLVNNAGVSGSGRYGVWNDGVWNWTLGVNLMGVIWGVEIFGPLIERTGEAGHIVNTASIAGLISMGSGAYSVSKYGVVALSEGLREELAPRKIGVSVLCPGFVKTSIAQAERNLPERFGDETREALATGQNTPIGDRIRAAIANGLEPALVGEIVRTGIEQDWPYIFTDPEFEPLIEARFAAIKQGFERIRAWRATP